MSSEIHRRVNYHLQDHVGSSAHETAPPFLQLWNMGLCDEKCTLVLDRFLPFLSLKVKVLIVHSYLTLCDPIDFSPLGSSVHGILQARILEWVAIPFSRGSSQPRDRTQVSCISDSLLSEPPGKPLSLPVWYQSSPGSTSAELVPHKTLVLFCGKARCWD